MDAELKTHTFRRTDDMGWFLYWETDAWCSDGSVIIERGPTAEESKIAALARVDEHHAFLASSPQDRLKAVLARAKGADHLLARDVTYAIRALSEIVLGEKP